MVIFSLLFMSVSFAEVTTNEPSVPTSSGVTPMPAFVSNNRPTGTLSPTETGHPTLPSTDEECLDNPDFVVRLQYHHSWKILNLTCKDYGNLGPAAEYCCKCKNDDPVTDSPRPTPGSESDSRQDSDKNDNFVYEDHPIREIPKVAIIFLVVLGLSVATRFICKCMGQHPSLQPQQRESNIQGTVEKDHSNALYELFLTKFYFQTVLPDKSNIAVNTSTPEKEHPSQNHHKDEAFSCSCDNLSSEGSPVTKNESCSICLESYSEGDTACESISTECNHVFHQECILEWLRQNDRCPLCRIDLLLQD